MKKLAILLIFSTLYSRGQFQALFNNTTQIRSMTERWELDTTYTKTTFLITPYKPIFILPVRWSSKPNEKPISGNGDPDYVAPDGTNFNNIESKFQLSFKVKILQGIIAGKGDLWVAYTQKAHWQLYNYSLSRPFREINYEPEVIFNYPLNFEIIGFKFKMAGVSYNHESNGTSKPFSRSWNRIIFHLGVEKDRWSFYIRPWLKLKGTKDENPDITKYIGRGDITAVYIKNGNIFSFTGSHNLNFKSTLRGNGTFSWSYPIKGNLKGHLQVSHGFGETLIDYNNLQTTIGVGISLIEWL